MGRGFGRRRLWVLALAGMTLTSLCVLVSSLSVPIAITSAAGGPQDALAPYLTIHGPNDGEPLNNSIDVVLEVAASSRCHVLLYEGSRFLASIPVVPTEGSPVQVITFPFDSTRFPNGPCRLSFYLFCDGLTRLMDVARLNTSIENPTLEISGERDGANLPLRATGRPRDLEYQLEVGADLDDLYRPPSDLSQPRDVEILDDGGFDGPGGSGGGADIVLNVDNLIKSHTLDSFLVLWTTDAAGRWAHSAAIPVRSLPGPAAYLKRIQVSPLTGTIYRR